MFFIKWILIGFDGFLFNKIFQRFAWWTERRWKINSFLLTRIMSGLCAAAILLPKWADKSLFLIFCCVALAAGILCFTLIKLEAIYFAGGTHADLVMPKNWGIVYRLFAIGFMVTYLVPTLIRIVNKETVPISVISLNIMLVCLVAIAYFLFCRPLRQEKSELKTADSDSNRLV